MKEDLGHKQRILRLVKLLLDMPFKYKLTDLIQRLGTSERTVRRMIAELKSEGFPVTNDKLNRYGFQQSDDYESLRELLHFTEKDQFFLRELMDKTNQHDKHAIKLKKKLKSIYNFQKLGLPALRKPYLDKIDTIERGIKAKKKVKLVNYRSSSSNKISDRIVEAFHIRPDIDSLHAFDVELFQLRHFKLSRIERIKLLDENWEYQKMNHHIKETDPFRIVDNDMVWVTLRFNIGAYNELIERFPDTLDCIQHDSEEDIFEFRAKVNHRFYGLANFILGFHHRLVEIVEPESLKDHIRAETEKILKKIEH